MVKSGFCWLKVLCCGLLLVGLCMCVLVLLMVCLFFMMFFMIVLNVFFLVMFLFVCFDDWYLYL